jgi:hypothetical protein
MNSLAPVRPLATFLFAGAAASAAMTPAVLQLPYALYLSRTDGIWTARKSSLEIQLGGSWTRYRVGRQSICVRLENSNPGPDAIPESSTGRLTVITGRRQENRPLYESVTFHDVYKGVDLAYSFAAGTLKSEFHLAVGVNPSVIRLRYEGGSPEIAKDGRLIVHAPFGTLTEGRPFVFQIKAGSKTPVQGHYKLDPDGAVSFRIQQYDHSIPLVIDPELDFSTFWGGSGAEAFTAIAVAPDGSIYAAGWTDSTNVPAINAYQLSNRGSIDAIVVKLDSTATRILYATYLGGRDYDSASAIAVDTNGNAYLAGTTYSSDYPTRNAEQPILRSGPDTFITKLDSTGSTVLFSTFFGGSGADYATGLALDGAGGFYVAMSTTSTDMRLMSPFQNANKGAQTGFVARFNSAGSLQYSTYLGGRNTDVITAIAARNGEAYVSGWTTSPDFPVRNAYQSYLSGAQTAFIAKLSASGVLVYSTYLGGSGGGPLSSPEAAWAIAVNSAGEAYVAGSTPSFDFPVKNPIQAKQIDAATDAFIAKLNASGNQLVFSTYLGGSAADDAFALALDSSGNVCVGGETLSRDFPLKTSLQSQWAGGYDAFITCLKADGSSLLFSSYLGGPASDVVKSMAIDTAGRVLVGGQTASITFPTSRPIQPLSSGSSSAFLSRITGALPASATFDFDRNGIPDLVWQNDATRGVTVWYMSGSLGNALQSVADITASAPGWTVRAIADMNRDGVPDLIWQSDATRAVSVWYMGGPLGVMLMGIADITASATGWTVRAAADMNRDGVPDLIWQSDATRAVSVWYMGGPLGNAIQAIADITPSATGWSVRGAADMNRDGVPDLIWQSDATRAVSVWYMGGPLGNAIQAIADITPSATGWSVRGAADMNRDGVPDLIWQSDAMRGVSVWYMGGPLGNTVQLFADVTASAPGWTVVGP